MSPGRGETNPRPLIAGDQPSRPARRIAPPAARRGPGGGGRFTSPRRRGAARPQLRCLRRTTARPALPVDLSPDADIASVEALIREEVASRCGAVDEGARRPSTGGSGSAWGSARRALSLEPRGLGQRGGVPCPTGPTPRPRAARLGPRRRHARSGAGCRRALPPGGADDRGVWRPRSASRARSRRARGTYREPAHEPPPPLWPRCAARP